MPEIAEREPKVISVCGALFGWAFRGLAARTSCKLSVLVARGTVYALGCARAEEMVLFTPS